jgi:hypothetical protein
MKKVLLAGLILISACAGGNYSAREDGDGFKPSMCANIPIGVEQFQYLDPSLKGKKISCAALARCTSLYALPAPPNVPCE